MLESIKICSMCGSSEPLQKSHIIPRSYFSSLKGKSGQLFVVNTDENTQPKLSNSDPKERLLCRKCEQFLSVNYERYGTRLLKDRRSVKRKKDHVVFENFRYKEFYLYLISIFWRASISRLDSYERVNLGSQINKILAHCVSKNTLKIQTSLRLDHFIKVFLLRVVDKSGQLDDLAIKKTLVGFGVEHREKIEDGVIYYFMVDGFIVVYLLDIESDIHMVRTKKYHAQLKNKQRIKVPIVDVCELKQIADGFSALTRKAIALKKSVT